MGLSCEVCGKGVTFGRRYSRRGMARRLGGAGRKVTGKGQRKFRPNVQRIRILTDTGAAKRMRVCTECIKKGKVRKAAPTGRKTA